MDPTDGEGFHDIDVLVSCCNRCSTVVFVQEKAALICGRLMVDCNWTGGFWRFIGGYSRSF